MVCSAVLFGLLSLPIGFAQLTPKALYDQGKYQESLDLLQKNGVRSAADFYNAGNCYYRLGHIGQAMSYYQKAATLAPGDDDIRYNLKLVEALADKQGSLARDQSFWSGRLLPLARRTSEAFTDFLLALCTLALALAAYRAKKRKLKLAIAVLQPTFLALFGVWALAGATTTVTILAHHAKLAAIVADLGVARSGPADTFTELFKLPAGTTVELTGESREGWQQIRFSLGNVGWIMEKDLLDL